MPKNEMLKIAKPILFNTEMVRAIQGRRKTVTRRVVKPQPESINDIIYNHPKSGEWLISPDDDNVPETKIKPPYKVGDILYVRETWCRGSLNYREEQYYYKADNKIPHCRWNPSIHMPKEAARIFLRVTDMRVERLQVIDGYGILAEGVDNGSSNPTMEKRWENMQRMAWSELWNSTIKKSDLAKYGWAANPWVWVIEFKQI